MTGKRPDGRTLRETHTWVDDPCGHDAKRCVNCGAFYSNARLAQARYGGWIEECAQRAPLAALPEHPSGNQKRGPKC